VKTTDRLLLLAIAAVVVLMVLLVLDAGPGGSGSPDSPASPGEPRAVDVDLLRRRLIRGELSDQEALYYR
jgi:hypothetical protein